MITFGEIDEFLQDEIKQECEKYGLVNRVVLWQDKNRTYTSDDLVMVYVEFGSVDGECLFLIFLLDVYVC